MDTPPLASIVLLAGIFLGFSLLLICAVLVHEAGHAAAALLCGFRITAVRVGPTQIMQPKSWRWALSRNELLSGFVQVQFRNVPGPWSKWQSIAFVIGGPLANFCPAILALPYSRGNTAAANLASLFAMVSALVGVAQLIPFRARGKTSDGAKLIALLFSRRKRDELLFVFSLRARIDEIRALYEVGRSQDALNKLEDFARRAESIPGLPSMARLVERLSGLRNRAQTDSPHAGDPIREDPTNIG
jgi:hypothetical protein